MNNLTLKYPIPCIKLVRAAYALTLKEAKVFVDFVLALVKFVGRPPGSITVYDVFAVYQIVNLGNTDKLAELTNTHDRTGNERSVNPLFLAVKAYLEYDDDAYWAMRSFDYMAEAYEDLHRLNPLNK